MDRPSQPPRKPRFQGGGPRGGPGGGGRGPRRPGPGGPPGPGRGPGGPRAGGGRPGARPPRKLHPVQLRQVRELTEKSHIPWGAAVRVVLGKATLNEVLQEMLREEKIKNLMAAHGLDRALATSIALGNTDLNIVLLRRRKDETLQANYNRSCLEEAQAAGSTVVVAMHNHHKVRGKVLSVDKYTFQFHEEGASAPVELHKTSAKFTYDPAQYKELKKFIEMDPQVKKMGLSPITRVKERHHFKNLSLQKALDEGLDLDITTLEGDTFRGKLAWFGRWELGLKFKGGLKLVVFRHAIYRLTVIEPPAKK